MTKETHTTHTPGVHNKQGQKQMYSIRKVQIINFVSTTVKSVFIALNRILVYCVNSWNNTNLSLFLGISRQQTDKNAILRTF